jgi:hypothetical protein
VEHVSDSGKGNNDLHSSVTEEVTTTQTTENWVQEPNGSGKWVPFNRTVTETTRKVTFE